MSWSIEERIGECRPFPAQVLVYRGETDERMAYVSGEVADRLKAENAKLRELATKMARALGVGSDWCDRDCLAEFGCTDSCPIADAMHEMGIKEVRDD